MGQILVEFKEFIRERKNKRRELRFVSDKKGRILKTTGGKKMA